jgi:thermostable 8-oxoguanine DNA glycosylase
MKRKEKLKWFKEEFEKIHDNINPKDSLFHYEFLRIRNFKLQNSSQENENHVEEITKEAFKLAEKDDIQGSIKLLLQLEGVAIPIASTILAMKYPDKFAIIDKRVITALGKKEWLKSYLQDPRTYEEYLLLLRKLAKERGVSLRDLERSLFEGYDNGV